MTTDKNTRIILSVVFFGALVAGVTTWIRWPDRYGDLDQELVNESRELQSSLRQSDAIGLEIPEALSEEDPLREYLMRALEAGSSSPTAITFDSMPPWMRSSSTKGVDFLLTFHRLRAAADVDGLIEWMESQGCFLPPEILENRKYRASYEHNVGDSVPNDLTPEGMYRSAFEVEMTRNNAEFRPNAIVTADDPIDIAVALRTDPADPIPMPSPAQTRESVMAMFMNVSRDAWKVWSCPGTVDELFSRDGQVLTMRASFIVRTRGGKNLPTHFVLDFDRGADQWRLHSMWIGNYVDKIYRTRY